MNDLWLRYYRGTYSDNRKKVEYIFCGNSFPKIVYDGETVLLIPVREISSIEEILKGEIDGKEV